MEAQSTEMTHTAELVYGRTYTYKGVRFEAGKPREITSNMAAELEALEVTSRDTRTHAAMSHSRFAIVEIGAEVEEDEEEEVKAASRSRKPSRRTTATRGK